MRVIGTAGHVDHGKSTLVKRLTGIDPDRLQEEKARQMTIDLGFAWLPLSGGETMGMIDVPGHRDFIGSMVAGVGGIDAVLFVIAADEGVMPQTREHLAILDLLGVEYGVIALTKIDLIEDRAWLPLITSDIGAAFAGTSLAHAEIIPVSAHTGEGISTLIDHIARLPHPSRANRGQPRLPIDRVFTLNGFGTVVTGTLIGGTLTVGDTICIQPSGITGRIRGLQSYHQSVQTTHPGTRVAVNVGGVSREQVSRGDVLICGDFLTPTHRFDAQFRHLDSADRPLLHNTQVRVHAGTAEVTARIRLLSHEALLPGETGWAQLELDRPLALLPQDRFVARQLSPTQTIGGGMIVDAHPAKRWRKRRGDVITALETRLRGSPAQRLALAAAGLSTSLQLKRTLGMADEEFAAVLAEAQNQALVITFSDGSLMSADSWGGLHTRLTEQVRQYHADYPLRTGIPRELLRTRLDIDAALLKVALECTPHLVQDGGIIRRHDHRITFDYTQQESINALLSALQSSPPPTYAEAAALVGQDVLHALIDLGDIIRLQADVLLTRPRYEAWVDLILSIIDAHGAITPAQARDAANTSRKIALALLEHLDSIGVTRRQGDVRVRR